MKIIKDKVEIKFIGNFYLKSAVYANMEKNYYSATMS